MAAANLGNNARHSHHRAGHMGETAGFPSGPIPIPLPLRIGEPCALPATVIRHKPNFDLAFTSLDAQRDACEATSAARPVRAGGLCPTTKRYLMRAREGPREAGGPASMHRVLPARLIHPDCPGNPVRLIVPVISRLNQVYDHFVKFFTA
jgi:hypothetical protein